MLNKDFLSIQLKCRSLREERSYWHCNHKHNYVYGYNGNIFVLRKHSCFHKQKDVAITTGIGWLVSASDSFLGKVLGRITPSKSLHFSMALSKSVCSEERNMQESKTLFQLAGWTWKYFETFCSPDTDRSRKPGLARMFCLVWWPAKWVVGLKIWTGINISLVSLQAVRVDRNSDDETGLSLRGSC